MFRDRITRKAPVAKFIGFGRRPFTAGAAALAVLWLGLAALADTGPFRFAWLSDTHIGSSTAADDLRAAVRDINSMTGLSFVVVSGDVTEYGSQTQLYLAKELLGELSVRARVLPGNHDCKWSESGATDFPRLWGADRFSFEEGGCLFIGMHQGPVMKMGDGHWGPQDVRWLAELLGKMSDTNQPIFFVTHYPLDEGIANWYAVLDLLKTRNTQAVLCGHGHSNRRLDFEGIPGVMGRSSLRAKAPAGGFNIVEVDGGQMRVSEHVTGGGTKPPWHAVPLGRRDYAAHTNRYPRPDFSVNTRYPQVKPVWSFSAGHTIAAAPTRCKDLVVVADGSGAVFGLSLADGRPRWTFAAEGAVYSTPAFADGRVVFGSTDGRVYALEAVSGKKLWTRPTSRPIVASPLVRNRTVYIGSSDGKFRALDLKTGRLVWEFGEVAGFVEARPAVYGGNVIFGAWDEHLYALNARTGQLAWKWTGDRPGTLLSPAACWPVAAAGKVFIVAPDRKMTALEAATGREIWRTADYVVRESIGISEKGSRFYVRAMNDCFYAFSTASGEPLKLWETNAQFGYDINSAMLAEKDGVVFYGTKNGLLFALDAKTGNIRWQHKMGVALVNTVTPLSRTDLLAADLDGRVALVREQPAPRSSRSRPGGIFALHYSGQGTGSWGKTD